MTIKEKARVAWEKDLKVDIISRGAQGATSKPQRCEIIAYNPGHQHEQGILTLGNTSDEIWFAFHRIVDITFVNEQVEEELCEDKPQEDTPAAIHEKLAHALKYEYPVTVMWRDYDRQRRNVSGKVIWLSKLWGNGHLIAEIGTDVGCEEVMRLQHIEGVQRSHGQVEESRAGLGAIHEKLTHALRYGYPVMITWWKSDEERWYWPGKVVDLYDSDNGAWVRIETQFNSKVIKTAAIHSVNFFHVPAEELSEDKPAEHDIAKERWFYEVLLGRILDKESGQSKASEVYAEPGHGDLLAAAPELADLMRDEVNNRRSAIDYKAKQTHKRITLLRKLGVPNVAPWYKGG